MKKKLPYGDYFVNFHKTICIMRISLALILVSSAMAYSAESYSQRTKLTFDLDSVCVKDVFSLIEEQSEFIFFYQDQQVDLKRKVSLQVSDEKIENILDRLFSGTLNNYTIRDRQILIGQSKASEAIKPSPKAPEMYQDKLYQPRMRELNGRVTDANGNALPGVNVIVKGTTLGVITNLNGDFSLSVPVSAEVLVFSFIGMETIEQVIGDRLYFSVAMSESALGLDEVVVIGYGQQKKITVTGSISSVTEKQLVQSPVANISNALAGRATGVLSAQRTGEPGEDEAEIRIRGRGTYGSGTAPLILVDGIETPEYNNLDPNEIESISILKDASSTAVYGVRGANGVLIITTKRGMIGKPQVSYSSNIAATRVTEITERWNAYDYVTGYETALQYDSYVTGVYTPLFTADEIEAWRTKSDPIFYPDVDWMDLLYKPFSFQHQHNLNIRGGTESVKYFVSLGLFDQRGLLNNTNLQEDFFDQNPAFKRYNFRSNFDFKITKRLVAKVNVTTQVENKRSPADGNTLGLIRMFTQANPIANPGIIDGKFVNIPLGKTSGANPWSSMYGEHRKSYNNNLDGSLRIEYDMDYITKGLRAHAMVSYQGYSSFYVSYSKPREQFDAVKDADNNTILISNEADGAFNSSSGSGKRRRSYAEAGLNYARTFGDHSVSALLLYNQAKNFDPGLQFLIPSGIQGLVGRIAYDYKNKYLAEFNAGYNGTENFAPGKRFGYFPAYSLGWVLSEESFFPKNNFVSFVKFRGSYGEVGNDKIGGQRFLYLPGKWGYSSAAVVSGMRGRAYHWGTIGLDAAPYKGAYEGISGNPDLIWEVAIKKNLGIDITLFWDKIRVTADLFDEKRENILSTPLNFGDPSGLFNNMPPVNLGKVNNKGWDGDITFNNRAGKFNYWVKANYTFARNTLIYKDEVPNPYKYLEETGKSIGQKFGFVDDGLYNSWMEVSEAYRPFNTYQNNLVQPGVINWKDINGDGKMDQFDKVAIGYGNFPEKTYGLSFGGDIKGFDFSLLFQGASNVSFIGGIRHKSLYHNWFGNNEFMKNSWSLERYEQGLPIYFPHYNVMGSTSTINALAGTYLTADASYIRLRNAEIGYRFEKLGFIKTLGLQSARVYFNGSNLWTYAYAMRKMYTGVDPEDYGGDDQESNTMPYPRTAVFNFGINVNF